MRASFPTRSRRRSGPSSRRRSARIRDVCEARCWRSAIWRRCETSELVPGAHCQRWRRTYRCARSHRMRSPASWRRNRMETVRSSRVSAASSDADSFESASSARRRRASRWWWSASRSRVRSRSKGLGTFACAWAASPPIHAMASTRLVPHPHVVGRIIDRPRRESRCRRSTSVPTEPEVRSGSTGGGERSTTRLRLRGSVRTTAGR